MSRVEAVRQIVAALESDDPRRAGELLTKDFIYQGPFPGPLDRPQFLIYSAEIKKAFPDWSYHFTFIQDEDSDLVRGIIQQQGTHTGTFSLPGMAALSATDVSVILPIEAVRFRFRENQLACLEIEDASGGGLEGILEQLGVELPRCLQGIFDKYPESA